MIMLLLFATGLFAGTIDAIAGGGGLISLTMLLSLGMPAPIAFGTNKLQGCAGTLMATHRYYRHGLISLVKVSKGIIFGFIGSIVGAAISQALNPGLLQKIVPILLFVIFLYTIFTPRLSDIDAKPRMDDGWFYPIFGFVLGFYDGFFGPGTGSLWVFVLTYFLGYNLIKATAYTKLFNLNSSLIAMVCFAIGNNIDYRYALYMALGQIIGGRLGAYLAIKGGARLIRPLFTGVVGVSVVTLAYRNYIGTSSLSAFSQALAGIGVMVFIFLLYKRKWRKQVIISSGTPEV